MDDTQLVKLFDVLAPRYADRNGGYTRIIKAGIRASDAAPIAIIEFVDRDVAAKGQDSGPVMTEEEVRSAKPSDYGQKGCGLVRLCSGRVRRKATPACESM